MNPLSPFLHSIRHARFTAALAAVVALTVAGLYLFIGLARETYIEPAYALNRYLTKFNLVQPDQTELDPDLAARIRANPDVARVLPEGDLTIKAANIGGASFPFRLIGLRAEDAAAVLAQSGVSLKEGRLPAPGTNEVALSEEIALGLSLSIGDTFDRTRDEKAYSNIVSPLRLAGILSGEVRLGILSYEFLDGDEAYKELADFGLLAIAKPGREAAMESYLMESVRNSTTKTITYRYVSELTAGDQRLLYTLGFPIVLLVSAAIALTIDAINQLAFQRRLAEFGILQAVGYRTSRLVMRLATDTAGPALVGWIAGILLGWGGMAAASYAVYAPRGFAFGAMSATALLLTAAVPATVAGSALLAAVRTLGRMDPVAVVERGQLTLEGERFRPASSRSGLPRPLAPATYYRRHPRQAFTLFGATLFLILGTALLFCLFAAGADAVRPSLNNLLRMSAVSPNSGPLEAELVGLVREHPAVERTIDAYAFVPLKISIPPMFPNQPIETLCVTAADIAFLTELYHLSLAEGRLPREGTNEIVIPWAAAKNRNLRIGDVLGDPAAPAYPGAPSLPVPIAVSGIFAPAGDPAEETWFSFMSLEYVEPFRASGLSLIVVPKAGGKESLDAWLEGQIAGGGRVVLTYRNQQAAMRREMGSMLETFALMEAVITLVAALALAGLHAVFFSGREAELGVLCALGFTRTRLIGRVSAEVFALLLAAWAAATAGCLAVLLFLQYDVFAAAGLRLNFLNPVPWLATLPIPAAAFAACIVLTARALARMDPIAVIEKRM
jgi:ABC-type lipoprotein release transport system permease subunit